MGVYPQKIASLEALLFLQSMPLPARKHAIDSTQCCHNEPDLELSALTTSSHLPEAVIDKSADHGGLGDAPSGNRLSLR